jgi:hypothetical protein
MIVPEEMMSLARPRALLCAAAALAWSAAALAADPRPDWLSGQSAQYPREAFVLGVGQGDTREKAADAARAEIAKSFSLSLTATTSVSASEVDSNGRSDVEQSVSEDVRTSTRKVLDGVELSAYWDGPDDEHYALATLDRRHALSILHDKLAELDKSFADLRERLGKTEGKFARLRIAVLLAHLAKSRRSLNADVRVLSPDGKGVPAPSGLEDVLAEARKAVDSVKIRIAVSGEDSEKTASRLQDALSVYGLKANEGPGSADVVLEAACSAEKVPPDNLTWYWARGAMSVKLSYGTSGEVFERFEEDGEEASGDPDASVRVVLGALADKTADHVFKTLVSGRVLDD